MFCSACGRELKPSAKFCVRCGLAVGEANNLSAQRREPPEIGKFQGSIQSQEPRKASFRAIFSAAKRARKKKSDEAVPLLMVGFGAFGYFALKFIKYKTFSGVFGWLDALFLLAFPLALGIVLYRHKGDWSFKKSLEQAIKTGEARKALLVMLGVFIFSSLIYFARVGALFLLEDVFPQHDEKPPPEIARAGVLLGPEVFKSTIFYENESLGAVTELKFGPFNGPGAEELAVVGSRQVHFIDPREGGPILKRAVRLEGPRDYMKLIPLKEKDYLFQSRGSWCCPPTLMDKDGKVLWAYRSKSGANEMSGGDLMGDGTLSFVVGLNGGGGVHLVSDKGERIWRKDDGNVWNAKLADVDGDGDLEIVHTNAGGEIIIRDRNGKVVGAAKPNPVSARGSLYVSDFSIVPWPSQKRGMALLLAERNKIWLLNHRAKILAEYEAPFSGSLGETFGDHVEFYSGESPFFVVLVSVERWEKSLLYIYDPSGELVFQESLDGHFRAVAGKPVKGEDRETLLIGGVGKVLEYIPNPSLKSN